MSVFAGWMVMPRQRDYAFARNEHFYAAHTGGAIGASSVLLILPRETTVGAGNNIAPQVSLKLKPKHLN